MKNRDSLLPMSGILFLRFLGYHLMCMLVMLSVMAFLPGVWGAFVAQVFGLAIITVFPFLSAYRVGDRDHNKIGYHHIRYDRWKGLKAGLLGYSPFLLASVCMIAAKLGVIGEGYLPFYRVINSPFMALMQSLLPTTLTLSELSAVHVVLCALTSLIAPASVALGYWQGVNRLSVAEQFSKKTPE